MQTELPGFGRRLDALSEEAIGFIQEHFPEEQGKWLVAFSGGKDSMVVLDLVKRAGVVHEAHYSNPGIDPPELVKFIREYYPEVIEYKAPPFFMLMRKPRYGFPYRNVRWCCTTQKKNVGPNGKCITGIRSDESSGRKLRGRIVIYEDNPGKENYNPIFAWKERDVWDYIRHYEMPYCGLYDEGWDRLGCIVCPMISPSMKAKNIARWPKHWEAFRRGFFHVWRYKQGQAIWENRDKLHRYLKITPQQAWERYCRGDNIFTSKEDEIAHEREGLEYEFGEGEE